MSVCHGIATCIGPTICEWKARSRSISKAAAARLVATSDCLARYLPGWRRIVQVQYDLLLKLPWIVSQLGSLKPWGALMALEREKRASSGTAP
jgi:hypothetical protein